MRCILAKVPVAECYSINLTKPIHGTNRDVIIDHLFTSIDIAKKLHGHNSVTVVGTLKKTKIPQTFVEVKERKNNSAMFAFSYSLTLDSFLLSTMHPR